MRRCKVCDGFFLVNDPANVCPCGRNVTREMAEKDATLVIGQRRAWQRAELPARNLNDPNYRYGVASAKRLQGETK